MQPAQELQTILRLSGWTQTETAHRLGVSFVTFNRWIHGKALPRRKARARIDALYRECTGLTEIPEDALAAKKAILKTKAGARGDVLAHILSHPDIRDQFTLVLTHTSNSIEGATLTEAETAVVLFQNATLPDRTLVEHLEAKNHQVALLALFSHLAEGKPVSESQILKLHGMLMNGITPDAGSYRRHGVRIVGADVPIANHLKVPILMVQLVRDIQGRPADVIAHVASVHARFEQIHPFSDGNGRIGRLLMHAMLLRSNLPPAVIRSERKRSYYSALHRAQQQQHDSSLLEDFLCDAVLEGWAILQRRDVALSPRNASRKAG
jgi:Fic family protein